MRRFHLLLFLPLLHMMSLIAEEPAEFVTRRYYLNRVPNFHFPQVRQDGSCFCGGFFEMPEPLMNPRPGNRPSEDPFERFAPPEGFDPLDWVQAAREPELLEAYLGTHLQMDFPEGARARYQIHPQIITLHHTPDKHTLVQSMLLRNLAVTVQIQGDIHMIRFDADDIDRMERAHGGPLTDTILLNHWREGNGETLFAIGTRTINGVNAIIEHADEVIYPTKMAAPPVGDGESSESGPVVYGGMETRQSGFILNFTPVIQTERNTIQVTLLPEMAQDRGQDPELPEALRPLAPRFRSWNLTTSMSIRNGQTLLVGHSTSLDRRSRQYLFLTVTLYDIDGVPFSSDL